MGLKTLFNNLQTRKLSEQLKNSVASMINSPDAHSMTLEQLEQLANPRKPSPVEPIKILLPPMWD